MFESPGGLQPETFVIEMGAEEKEGRKGKEGDRESLQLLVRESNIES